jgi:hypothetical protein
MLRTSSNFYADALFGLAAIRPSGMLRSETSFANLSVLCTSPASRSITLSLAYSGHKRRKTNLTKNSKHDAPEASWWFVHVARWCETGITDQEPDAHLDSRTGQPFTAPRHISRKLRYRHNGGTYRDCRRAVSQARSYMANAPSFVPSRAMVKIHLASVYVRASGDFTVPVELPT